MTDLQGVLDAIQDVAVQQCAWCQADLAEDGESPDFCDAGCQQEWTERHNEVVELIGYREPYDVPAHAVNQFEMSSPETTPLTSVRYAPGYVSFDFTFDTSAWDATMRRILDRYTVLMGDIDWAYSVVPATPPCSEPVDYDFDLPSTPALSSDPEPPTMPDRLEPDWQGLVDRAWSRQWRAEFGAAWRVRESRPRRLITVTGV